MGPSLVDLLRDFAAKTPNALCLSFEDETLGYRDFDRRVNQVANAMLGQGIKPGDRVSILAPTAPVFYELFFACAKAGVIMMPLNWRLSPREIAGILADGQPSLMLVGSEMMHLLADVKNGPQVMELEKDYARWRDAAGASDPKHPFKPDDALLLLYTGGTTGLPKGVMISHSNLAHTQLMARELWAFKADSVNIVAMPLFHVGGLGYGLHAFSTGGHTVLIRIPDAKPVIEAMLNHGGTHGFFVPAVIQRLVDHVDTTGARPTTMKRIVYGGAPMGEALLKRAIAVLGCGFCHAYGMTETSGTVITMLPEDHDPGGPHAARLRSCGRPVPWAEVALFDPATGKAVATGEVGEIRVRSAMNMLGYWKKPKETAETITPEGWLCSGDAAYQDADGYFYIHDRFKDMIISGGENVYPAEVENVLYDHPGVAEVAVIGVPHERWGETPRAYIVLREGHSPTESELIQFARGRLAHYKCPTSVAFVSSFPRSAAGKVLKREMRNKEWSGK